MGNDCNMGRGSYCGLKGGSLLGLLEVKKSANTVNPTPCAHLCYIASTFAINTWTWLTSDSLRRTCEMMNKVNGHKSSMKSKMILTKSADFKMEVLGTG